MLVAFVAMDKMNCVVGYGVMKVEGAKNEKEKKAMILKKLDKKSIVSIDILLETK